MITLENKKIHDYIVEKDAIVVEGKKKTDEIEALEKKIKGFEEKEKAITAKVKPSKELEEKGNLLVDEINAKVKELNKIGDAIEVEKLAAVPAEMKKEHEDLMKEREKKERERNKLALKVQKYKDRIIPFIQKECKPFLKEYDDISTAKVKDGKILIGTFNHLEDWKRKFRSR